MVESVQCPAGDEGTWAEVTPRPPPPRCDGIVRPVRRIGHGERRRSEPRWRAPPCPRDASPRRAAQAKRPPSLAGLPDRNLDHPGIVPRGLPVTDASDPASARGGDHGARVSIARGSRTSPLPTRMRRSTAPVEPVFALHAGGVTRSPESGPWSAGLRGERRRTGMEGHHLPDLQFRLNLDLVDREAQEAADRMNPHMEEVGPRSARPSSRAFRGVRKSRSGHCPDRGRHHVLPVRPRTAARTDREGRGQPPASYCGGIDVTMPFAPSALTDFSIARRKGGR